MVAVLFPYLLVNIDYIIVYSDSIVYETLCISDEYFLTGRDGSHLRKLIRPSKNMDNVWKMQTLSSFAKVKQNLTIDQSHAVKSEGLEVEGADLSPHTTLNNSNSQTSDVVTGNKYQV
ncbi:uncharacterized protein LOC106079561 isoform X3 [Biomphalaria glabrata]|uniref:Uncharacterized protein LOC106079561 isoform X3 n=1 Tax=Biomphalaria glabrata TaxID=6526 RepID=A0A9W3BAA5_BIOGL|nr:uncharacterized protein LOC106079561 isoform X3 [Biomphalaria glabrata]